MHILGEHSLSFDKCVQLFNGDSNQNDITLTPKCLMPLLSPSALLPKHRDDCCSDFLHHELVFPVLELHRVGTIQAYCIMQGFSHAACIRIHPWCCLGH